MRIAFLAVILIVTLARAADPPEKIRPLFAPPDEFKEKLGEYRSPLLFEDGTPVKTAEDWHRRRKEIREKWFALIGKWPEILAKPRIEIVSKESRENFTQHKIRVEIAAGVMHDGYLLAPPGDGPFAAVVVPFYEPETSIGLKGKLRDYAYQLARRGFVTLAIGTPGGDAWKGDTGGTKMQTLSYLAYVAANCNRALATWPGVDARRIGIVGHSYGGKWALFASCLNEEFAAAVWSDPGIVFDEKRANVNYWEPWYLGREDGVTRMRGVITAEAPRTGPYKIMIERRMDLHELHALMAPRPFLVSAGSEDPLSRWIPLNHSIAVNKLLGQSDRVAMHNRKTHDPTEEANEAVYTFFEWTLGTVSKE